MHGLKTFVEKTPLHLITHRIRVNISNALLCNSLSLQDQRWDVIASDIISAVVVKRAGTSISRGWEMRSLLYEQICSPSH